MKNISQNRYTKENVTIKWLNDNGFRCNKILSDNNIDIYAYRFPVHKYKDMKTTLECEILIILQTSEVKVNVYDCNTKSKYMPFYCVKYGDYEPLLKSISEKIERKLKDYGIKMEA